MIKGLPYWRLSGFYFFYFAVVGALNPYLGLYLSDVGLNAHAIGMVNGVLMGTKIIAPNFWGWLCDKTGQRLRIITVGSFMACVFFAGLFWWQTLWPILVLTLFYSFFWNAVLAQFDALTIERLGKSSHRYSQIRVWGSVGFIAAVVSLGWLFDRYPIAYLIPITWLFLLLIALTCLSIPKSKIEPPRSQSGAWWLLLKKPAVLAFFISAFLLQFSFGAYYSFFSLHLEQIGYSRTTIGMLWALGVLAEVILFLGIHRFIQRWIVSRLLFWSLFFTAIRWLLIAFYSDNVSILILAQIIHALSFGGAHAASVELVRRFFKGRHAGQGQALYSAVTFGLGGASGAIISGYLWFQGAAVLFSLSAALVFLGAIIIRLGLWERKHCE